MTDSTFVFAPGSRLTDSATGAPMSGAVLRFFDANTTNPKTVFADSDLSVPIGVTVTTDSLGYPTSDGSTKSLIWVGSAPYKIVIETAAGVQIATHDNIKGAVEVTDPGDLSVIFSTPVVTKSLDYTILTTDQSTEFIGNSNGGNVTFTLPSAVTVEDGWFCFIQHGGTANQVRIATVSSQTIADGATNYGTQMAMVRSGESLKITSDGGNWRVSLHTAPHVKIGQPVLTIADRLSAPPGSPTVGALYIISGTPTGAWSSFAEHDIAMYTGAAWIKFTPPSDCGWIAWVQDENLFYRFIDSAWVAESASTAVRGTVLLGDAAAMEAKTASRAVTADIQQRHPGHPKAWGYVSVSGGTPTLAASENLTSITDTADGRLTASFGTDFSGVNYSALVTITIASLASGGSNKRICGISPSSKSSGSIGFFSSDINSTPDLSDPVGYDFVALGDQ